MMNIAYLTADVGVPVFGTKGASTHVRALAAALTDLGHRVLILSPNCGSGPRPPVQFQVEEVPLGVMWESIHEPLKEDACRCSRLDKDFRNLLYNSRLESAAALHFDAFKPDVIYERYSLFGLSGLFLARRYGIPLILEVNAPLPEEQEQQRGLSLPCTAREVQRKLFSEAGHLIAVSNWLKEYAIEYGADPERTTVLPNGVDPVKFAPSGDASCKKNPEWKNKFIAGYVGTMKSWHGLPSLLEAVKILKERKRNILLLLVGEGPELPHVKTLIKNYEIENYTYLTGAIPHEEVPRWIDAMDAAVVPFSADAASYFSPVKLFEYMAKARPVIAAKIGQTADIISPGRTGWLYEPGNSRELAEHLEWMEENREQIQQAGKNACHLVRTQYTWKKNAESVIKITQRHKETK